MSDLLQYKDYFGTVEFSVADDIFHGKILGIDDLVTFEGDSVRAIKKAFLEAVDDYIQTCVQLGKEANPNKAFKGSFNIRISPTRHKEAALFAATLDVSLNDFVKSSIDFALENRDKIVRKITGSGK